MDVEVNYLAIFVAVLVSMVVGSIWYARSVFGDTWIKLARIDMKKDGGSVWKPIAISVALSFVTAYILAHVTFLSNKYFGNSFLQDALTTAFWLWLGLVAARIITHDSFEGRPRKLTAITLGNEFVTIMLMGLAIGLFGIK
jgi:ABC-type Fe3+ transport system permease subunit